MPARDAQGVTVVGPDGTAKTLVLPVDATAVCLLADDLRDRLRDLLLLWSPYRTCWSTEGAKPDKGTHATLRRFKHVLTTVMFLRAATFSLRSLSCVEQCGCEVPRLLASRKRAKQSGAHMLDTF